MKILLQNMVCFNHAFYTCFVFRLARVRVMRKAFGHLCYVLFARKNTNTLEFAPGYFQLSLLYCCCCCCCCLSTIFDVTQSPK